MDRLNKKCAFTICTKNYIGLAQTLEKSLKIHDPEIDFYIFIADEMDNSSINLPKNIIFAQSEIDISQDKWIEMSFKYNLVEFCTSIKPFCFQSIFKKGYEKVVYFDPDILLFDSIGYVYEKLDFYKAILTPHRVDIESDLPNRGGLFNLGFLGLKKSVEADRLLGWWGRKLLESAFAAPAIGLFTDQKWMDHISIVLAEGDYLVSKHLGLNFAPWNFCERELVEIEQNKFIVNGKNAISTLTSPLVFMHFSAFNYKALGKGEYSKDNEVPDKGIESAIDIYASEIKNGFFFNFINLKYSFSSYSNGEIIGPDERKIYNKLLQEGFICKNPFDYKSDFYQLLKNRNLLSNSSMSNQTFKSYSATDISLKLQIFDLFFYSSIKIFGYKRISLYAKFLMKYMHPFNRVRLLGKQYRKFDINHF